MVTGTNHLHHSARDPNICIYIAYQTHANRAPSICVPTLFHPCQYAEGHNSAPIPNPQDVQSVLKPYSTIHLYCHVLAPNIPLISSELARLNITIANLKEVRRSQHGESGIEQRLIWSGPEITRLRHARIKHFFGYISIFVSYASTDSAPKHLHLVQI